MALKHYEATREMLWYNDRTKMLYIGCENYPLSYWLENYNRIGQDNSYTETEIKEYHEYMIELEKTGTIKGKERITNTSCKEWGCKYYDEEVLCTHPKCENPSSWNYNVSGCGLEQT